MRQEEVGMSGKLVRQLKKTRENPVNGSQVPPYKIEAAVGICA
jgi:hypothetical protein